MGLFIPKSQKMMDTIRCDEPSYLIWKWRPAGADTNSKRSNAIRWGSSLRVKEGSVAVLIYNQPSGLVYDYIEGPADMILETYNLPVLANLIGRLYDGGTPFQAEVYFINLAELVQIKFGVPFFDVFDPRFPDYGVPVAVRGTINFKITDYKEFIRLYRLNDFKLETFQQQIRATVSKVVKSAVINAPEEYGISAVQLERKITQINEQIEGKLRQRLYQDFGVSVSVVDVAAIELDKASDAYQQLKSVTQDVSTATIQAQTAVNIKNMQDMQRINAEHTEASLKAQREESQYAQHLQIQSEHFAVHQLNQQTTVGIAGAEALGYSSGMGGSMNPAAMMAGMSVGSAIGQNVAGMVSGVFASAVPPPVPAAQTTLPEYHIAVNGKANGPYSLEHLRQLVASGTFSGDSLVWKPGMSKWEKAGEISELRELFNDGTIIPPPLP